MDDMDSNQSMVSGLPSGLMRPETCSKELFSSVQSAISEEIHIQAVHDHTAELKRLLDFIVKLQGSEEHLVGVLHGKPSKWSHKLTSSRVPVYLDSEEQLSERSAAEDTNTTELHRLCRGHHICPGCPTGFLIGGG